VPGVPRIGLSNVLADELAAIVKGPDHLRDRPAELHLTLAGPKTFRCECLSRYLLENGGNGRDKMVRHSELFVVNVEHGLVGFVPDAILVLNPSLPF